MKDVHGLMAHHSMRMLGSSKGGEVLVVLWEAVWGRHGGWLLACLLVAVGIARLAAHGV